MSSNVHTLEKVRALPVAGGRPDRTDVEAAFRTIIQWTRDNPEGDGLIEYRARALVHSKKVTSPREGAAVIGRQTNAIRQGIWE